MKENKKIIKVPLTFNDIDIKTISTWDEKDYMDIQLVHIFSGMDKKVLRTLPISAIEKTSAHLRLILSKPTQENPERLIIDGVEYGFIKDWKSLTAGEYVDIAHYVEDPLKNASKIMSILYRPITEEWKGGYKIEDYEGTSNHEIFNDVLATYFYGAIGFFLSTMMDSVITSLQYLENQAIEINKPKTKKK
jgi:hypothetical protein